MKSTFRFCPGIDDMTEDTPRPCSPTPKAATRYRFPAFGRRSEDCRSIRHECTVSRAAIFGEVPTGRSFTALLIWRAAAAQIVSERSPDGK